MSFSRPRSRPAFARIAVAAVLHGLALLVLPGGALATERAAAQVKAPAHADAPAPAGASAHADAPANRPFLMHLPGISGSRAIDRMLVSGLTQGGVDAETEIYDWTGEMPGLNSLFARKRNEAEAAKVADAITRRFRAAPARPIYLTCHSGGAGIVAWALERLPEDVSVEAVVFIAPALSPGYDLSRALAHVRVKAYVLSSVYDPVLGTGTRLFGTIDGVKSDAAGRIGFVKPTTADEAAYAKLVAVPYDPAWMRFHNIGDHVGPMMRPFAKEVIARLLLTGQLPVVPPLLSQPATAPAAQSMGAVPAHCSEQAGSGGESILSALDGRVPA